jgi:hypothetical protein
VVRDDILAEAARLVVPRGIQDGHEAGLRHHLDGLWTLPMTGQMRGKETAAHLFPEKGAVMKVDRQLREEGSHRGLQGTMTVESLPPIAAVRRYR